MFNDPKRFWEICLDEIKSQINRQSFKTWFRSTEIVHLDTERLTIKLKDQFTADWIEQHYFEILQAAVQKILGLPLEITLAIDKGDGNLAYSTPAGNHITGYDNDSKISDRHFNPRYTFDNFVVGNSNQFAHAAALAISEKPGSNKYNPLFIYGGVGLGKTHLLQAIGHFVNEENSKKKVIYVTSERFTNEFIGSLMNNTTQEFDRFYKNLDVLLIDDVHFFSGKEGIQSEFFHIFNALHQKGKQLVLTSDTSPGQITGLTERLLSRFKWGLIVDIRPPDYEMRMAILYKKAKFDGIELPPEVLAYLAQNINSNIRELEGSLIRLVAFASISGQPFTVDLAREVVSHYQTNPIKSITIQEIQKKVAGHFALSPNSLSQKIRTKEVALARQVAMYLSRKLTGNTLKIIGLQFGGRDHSTVLHACNLVEGRLKKDTHIRDSIDKLLDQLQD
ncbi:chromosomal replication initiator protein DnaA [bacterium]|nr:chromosomal replication initiator protein DnaA [bacterium]